MALKYESNEFVKQSIPENLKDASFNYNLIKSQDDKYSTITFSIAYYYNHSFQFFILSNL